MKFNMNITKWVGKFNYEDAPAFELTPEMELYSSVVTASLENTFYEAKDERVERIRGLIKANDPLFVAKLAVYTREKMHLRSVPLMLAVELAKNNSGNALIGKVVDRVIQRADEITELLSCYQLANKATGTKKLGKLSKQVQKGIASSFNKFDEYQFAKYNRTGVAIKLRDALFLTHPKAKDEDQQLLFNKIAAEELATPYTWETELSALGQQLFATEEEKALAFKHKWEELIDSEKVGYMALLRNLRNMLDAEISLIHVKKAAAYLSNAEKVAKSKQLPFRFLAAYRELSANKNGHVSVILDALEKAVTLSAANIKGFNENTKVLIACDVSGSMQKPVSARSKILLYDIGLMLAMLMKSRCKNAITGMFGDKWKVVNVPTASVLANVDAFYKREGEVGYATNGYLVLKDLINSKRVVDKVLFFTDCQLWNNNSATTQLVQLWSDYKRIAPTAKMYLFDLAGYGTTPLKTDSSDVFLIAGWSDKLFDVLAAIEDGQNALSEINAIEL
ncbi:TROVE domain-containing protein [Solitalea canadensis DSM 3403]|uniref:TROVE domain-containing protein n=2 Tax=Solitalea canadensis TaxID=995 RepID=H8KLI6_SOLCM|nr:TROVE domain-containing protein [Solitalea canadensis DSM 3403]